MSLLFFKKLFTSFLTAISFLAISSVANASSINVLHEFRGGPDDGAGPDFDTGLVFDGTSLFGVTENGGDNDLGVIYSINPDGSNFTLLHEFNGTDGSFIDGKLTLDGTRLYGTANSGGTNDEGVIFGIDTDGSNFSVLHNFDNSLGQGNSPFGFLALDNSIMYGTTQGGVNGEGTIYSINTDGTGFNILHNFTGGSGGSLPRGLILGGTTLYGLTGDGGNANGDGIIYSIETDGTDFTVLHDFMGGADGASDPRGNLLLIDSTLYGMTDNGGDENDGTIFSIGIDGTNFTLLHEFVQEVDGKDAEGSLIQLGSRLFGMTEDGGETDDGIIFSINLDGSDFQVIHEFDEPVTGGDPEGSLFAIGDTLYGVTNNGDNGVDGTIFSASSTSTTSVPEPTSIVGFLVLGALGWTSALKRKLKPSQSISNKN